jgi:exopolysaccharide biosynthesis WecB/TagA/CpsF family protein
MSSTSRETRGENYGRVPLNANTGAAERLVRAISVVANNMPLPTDDLFIERTRVVSFVNSHAVNLASTNPAFLELLLSADLLLRDGIGMSLLYRWLGLDPGRNMNGTDYIPKVLYASHGASVALYGSTLEVADAAAQKLRSSGVTVVSIRDGFQPIAEYANAVRADRPRVVILGMGMPKQETVAQHLRALAAEPLLIINGGAILDFIANRFRRAPLLVRQLGLEWLFRLLLEPRRLWRRYLIGNAVFLGRAARLAIRVRCAGMRDS